MRAVALRRSVVARCTAAPRQLVHRLLDTLYRENGQVCPVSGVSSGQAAGEPADVAVRLENWNALLRPLHDVFAIRLTPDDKALVVGGCALAPPLPPIHTHPLSHACVADAALAAATPPARARAAAVKLQLLVQAIHDRTVKDSLTIEATKEQEAEQRAQAHGGCRLRAHRTRKWFRSLDQDSLSIFLTTLFQCAGVYSCIIVRTRARARHSAPRRRDACDAVGRAC